MFDKPPTKTSAVDTAHKTDEFAPDSSQSQSKSGAAVISDLPGARSVSPQTPAVTAGNWPFKPVARDSTDTVQGGTGAPPPLPDGLGATAKPSKGKFFAIGLTGIVFIAAGIFVYTQFFRPDGPSEQSGLTGSIELENSETDGNSSTESGTNETEVEPEPPEPEPTDTDFDGLTDEQERAIGTSEFSADTDGDGLLDLDEVDVYGSDPLNEDTDGDGFGDGVEARHGYDPTGSG